MLFGGNMKLFVMDIVRFESVQMQLADHSRK